MGHQHCILDAVIIMKEPQGVEYALGLMCLTFSIWLHSPMKASNDQGLNPIFDLLIFNQGTGAVVKHA